MSELNQYIAKRIKDLRDAAEMTQTALAGEVGVTPNTVSRWEGGVYQPSVGDLEKLARIFGRPVTTFLPGEQSVTKEQSALLSATGDLPPEDIEELRRYADFVRARHVLRKKK